MSGLKRCPFCGGEAKLMDNGHWVWCQHCLVESTYYDTKEEAIKAWNTRKPMDRIVERLEKEGQKMSEAKSMIKYGKASPSSHRYYKAISVKKAIEIVKEEGGMNE